MFSHPDPLPRITTPPVVRAHSPASSNTSSHRHDNSSSRQFPPSLAVSPSRVVSPNRSATPLLNTPPAIEAGSPSPGHYDFPSRSSRSNTRHVRGTTPSDTLSTGLSPSLGSRSSGASLYSSGAGVSQCSASSSEYLTPPLFQGDSDKIPYRARNKSSSSLTMLRRSKRANTMPDGKEVRRKRHGKRHRCRHKIEGRRHVHWAIPGCQVAPTAPRGRRELCRDHTGSYRPTQFTRGNTDTYGRMMPQAKSEPAPVLVSRRWSSVEIGTHQIHIPKSVPVRPALSNSTSPKFDSPGAARLSPRFRSSTFTRGVVEDSIIETVRDKLTYRKISPERLPTPATITLRRASEFSEVSGMSTVTEVLTANDSHTGGATPKAQPREHASERRESEYLITRNDIDSIAELIEENLKRKYRPHNRASARSPVYATATKTTRSLSITDQGVIPIKVSPMGSAETNIEVKTFQIAPQTDMNLLQVSKRQHGRQKRQSNTSKPSEVIWDSSQRQNSSSLTEDDDMEKKNESESHYSSAQTSRVPSPQDISNSSDEQSEYESKHGGIFDPKNANASINEWSWNLPVRQASATSSASVPDIDRDKEGSDDSRGNQEVPRLHTSASDTKLPQIPLKTVVSEIKAASKVKRTPKATTTQEPEVKDVISFPALPARKTTSDWFSPLPDIGSSEGYQSPALSPSQKLSPSHRTLYDSGVDATGTSIVRVPKHKSSWLSLGDVAETQTKDFKIPDFEARRKSVVKIHPKTPARTGVSAGVGSALGSSSGERRKSSTKYGTKKLTRVQTIDNACRPSPSRADTWSKPRPPSVAPVGKAPSPILDDSGNDLSHHATRTLNPAHVLKNVAGDPCQDPNDNVSDSASDFEQQFGQPSVDWIG